MRIFSLEINVNKAEIKIRRKGSEKKPSSLEKNLVESLCCLPDIYIRTYKYIYIVLDRKDLISEARKSNSGSMHVRTQKTSILSERFDSDRFKMR